MTSVLSWAVGWPASPARAKLGDEGVDVTLVDRNDYHQFQPLLYQVASSQLPGRGHRATTSDDLQGLPVGDRRDGGRDRSRPVRTQPGPVRRADAHRVARGDGRGSTAELLRCARRRRARVPAVLGGRRRAAAAAPAAAAAAGHGRRRSAATRAALDVVVVGGGPDRGRDHRRAGRADACALRQHRPARAARSDHHRRPRTGLARPFSSKAHEYAVTEADRGGRGVKLGGRRHGGPPGPGRVRRRQHDPGPDGGLGRRRVWRSRCADRRTRPRSGRTAGRPCPT